MLAAAESFENGEPQKKREVVFVSVFGYGDLVHGIAEQIENIYVYNRYSPDPEGLSGGCRKFLKPVIGLFHGVL